MCLRHIHVPHYAIGITQQGTHDVVFTWSENKKHGKVRHITGTIMGKKTFATVYLALDFGRFGIFGIFGAFTCPGLLFWDVLPEGLLPVLLPDLDGFLTLVFMVENTEPLESCSLG